MDVDRQIYTLATLYHMKEYYPAQPPESNDFESKHLQLLNDIALLLVHKEQGDVAAVSMAMSSGRIDFYYAKNGPCDPAVRDFLGQIRKILAESNNINIMSKNLVLTFLKACVHKFRGRLIKARKALEACGDILGPGSTFEESNKMSSRLSGWQNLNDRQILAHFFQVLTGLDASIGALNADKAQSANLSLMASIIGNMLLLFFSAFLIANDLTRF